MRLSDCFVDVIAYVAYFIKNVESKQPPFDNVKADIQRLLTEGEGCLHQSQFSKEDFDQARFAVCAWIDEIVLSSNWQEKTQWMKEQLQRIYYQTTDAGEEFFERLNRLSPHQTEVREVYYLCLALGFAGRYCNEGDEYLLEQLKISNLKLLTGSSVGIPSIDRGELFPGAYPIAAEVEDVPQPKKTRLSLFALACLGAPVVLFLGLYLVYRFVLSGVGENILSRIP